MIHDQKGDFNPMTYDLTLALLGPKRTQKFNSILQH